MKEIGWTNRLPWVLSILGFAILFCAEIESFDFISSAVLGLTTLGGIVAGSISIIFGLRQKRRTWVIIGAHVFVIPLLAVSIGGKISSGQRERSLRLGDSLVAALSTYHLTKGRYPDELAALVPDHISKVPLTGMSAIRDIPFYYRATENDGYTISFPSTAWMICHRTQKTEWVCDD